MQATGMLFMSRAKPAITTTHRGVPQLTLMAVHRIGTHQTEPWRLVWTDPAAMEFMAQHAKELIPGRPLMVTTKNMRAHVCGALPEIQAEVAGIELVLVTQKEEAVVS